MNRPWMKFYPSDWRSDPALRMCSLAARGLWMEMLAIMHEAEPYGHLVVKGVPVSPAALAKMVGVGLKECRNLLATLRQVGVFSETEQGVIYSRRMTRDYDKALKDKQNGKKGGNPDLLRGVNPPDKPHKPEARGQKAASAAAGGPAKENSGNTRPDSPANATAELRARIARAFEEAGRLPLDTSRVPVWVAQGYDPDLIVAVVRESMAKNADMRSLSYCEARLREAHERKASPPATPPRPKAESGSYIDGLSDERWRTEILHWKRTAGAWGLSRHTPPPDNPRTKVPQRFLDEFGIKPWSVPTHLTLVEKAQDAA